MNRYRLPFMLWLAAAGVALAEQPLRIEHRRDLQPQIAASVAQGLDRWVEFYKLCHAHPELSLQEKESASRIARLLAESGYKVTEGVGGHGVVGVLVNGEGPTVLLRGDMDALPVTEDTGLSYASKVRSKRSDGTDVGVMHACGHDIHQTVLMATAETLAAIKANWRGTLMVVAQPAEELGLGARLMIEDGLFARVGVRPDYCLALHVHARLPAGQVAYAPGWATANVDSVDITVWGRGGHGSKPEDAIDPIVAAAAVVTNLQTLVSRRVPPTEPAVVTVGSFHAGSKHNIIPDEARLQLTVRSYTDEVRHLLLEGIAQIAVDTCRALGCAQPPRVVVRDEEFTPAGYNNPELTEGLVRVFEQVLGEGNVIREKPVMGGEDFGRYGRHVGAPAFMWWLGTVERSRYEASTEPGAEPLPALHSARYAPDPGASIRTGVRTFSAAVLSLLNSRS